MRMENAVQVTLHSSTTWGCSTQILFGWGLLLNFFALFRLVIFLGLMATWCASLNLFPRDTLRLTRHALQPSESG